jgi:Tol biopolymer transport system component
MRLLRAALLALVASFVVASCQVVGGPGGNTNGAPASQGRVAWPKDGDLWIYDVNAKQQQKLTNLPGGAAVTGASWSPDGKRIVYSQFWRRPNERASGADLFISNADGSNPQIFAERDAPNGVVESPEWSPGGRIYYSVRHTQAGRESLQIVRQAEGGQPEVLIDGGYNPTVSPDESTLIYLRNTRAGQAMMKKTLGQPGEGCELMSDQVFQYLSQPRISPEGAKVALGGSGEPNMQPSGCGSASSRSGVSLALTPGPSPRGRGEALLDLAGMLEPAVAYAHGLPADVYTLNLDGSGLTRVADIKDDDPTVAWSPDGSKLAIFGIGALYMVDSKGGPPTKLVEQGGYGGLDWTR